MKRLIVIVFLSFCLFACTKFILNESNNNISNQDFAKMGLHRLDYNDILDSVGQWHNDYQDFLLKKIVEEKIRINDTVALQAFVSNYSKDFFKKKGIIFEESLGLMNSNGINRNTDDYIKESLSVDAIFILNQLQTELKKFEMYDDRFISNLTVLKLKALRLKNQTEIMRVGIPISIALYSFKYWNTKKDYWAQQLLGNIDSKGESLIKRQDLTAQAKPKPCNVNLNKVGGADVKGAIVGAYLGAAAGPATAFAGGLIASSTGSLGNILNQAMDCQFSWWPF